MIRLQDVRKVYTGPDGADVVAVAGVSLEVEEGETLCLIGTSGSGKTTTMKMINRLIEPTAGTILVDDQNVQELDVIRLRRKIGYVIQKGGLFPHMTVGQNVGLLCELEGWPDGKQKTRVAELLDLVNLPAKDYADRYPAELSGGQRQRVGVARALALDPDYILMDEPFGALDPITRESIHEEFKQLKQSVKKTMIVVTHDMSEAFELGDRIALMDKGELIQWGTEEDFRDRPASEFVVDFLKSHLASPSSDTLTREALDPKVKVVAIQDPSQTMGALRAQLNGGTPQAEDPLPVVAVDGDGRLRGLIPAQGFHADLEAQVGALLEDGQRTVAGSAPLRSALEELLSDPAPLLPVQNKEQKILGAVTPDSLLSRL